jgi:hypothetical protein
MYELAFDPSSKARPSRVCCTLSKQDTVDSAKRAQCRDKTSSRYNSDIELVQSGCHGLLTQHHMFMSTKSFVELSGHTKTPGSTLTPPTAPHLTNPFHHTYIMT